METQTNMENITFNQLAKELVAINNELNLTEQSIEATQIELDKTEKQIEMIEEKRIEKMRSQIEAAKRTLADKQFVLQERQELLKARQSYLQRLKVKGNVDEEMTPSLEHDSSLDAESSALEDMKLDSAIALAPPAIGGSALKNEQEVTGDRQELNSKLLRELQEGLNNETLRLTEEGYLTDDGLTCVCLEIKCQPLSEQEEFISKFVNYFRQLLTDEQVNTLEQLPNN